MMAHRKSQTLIIISSLLLLLLLTPIFCEATDQHDTETEETSSGEEPEPEVARPVLRPGYGASPDEGPEGEGEEESDSAVSLAPASAAAEDSEEEETNQQSTPSSVAAVGKDSNHLPRDLDESDESEEDSEEHDTEEPEVDELTTVLAVSSSSLPLAPIPPEVQDNADHADSDASPNNETLRPEPSQTVIIWDGTGEPDREVTNNEPEHPIPQPEDKPANQPERSVNQTEKPVNQGEEPHSDQLQGGSNGNGQTKENESDGVHKSEGEAHEDRPGAKYDPVTSTGSTSSSPMAWVVVFAVVSSAMLICGMYESESDRDSSCHFGCRHNFDDFNPYAWPPTPARRNETTLRPIT